MSNVELEFLVRNDTISSFTTELGICVEGFVLLKEA